MDEPVTQPREPEPHDDALIAIVRDPGADRGARHRALEQLFARHHARVREQCRRLLGERELADDATQEIFLGLLDAKAGYEGRRHFGSWLYIVVRNHCFNLLRRRRRETGGEAAEVWMQQLTDGDDPHRSLQRRETAELLERICAERLNPREQQVVHLRYVWGLRVKQINELLGLENVSGARSQLATAMRKLREALAGTSGLELLDAVLEEE